MGVLFAKLTKVVLPTNMPGSCWPLPLNSADHPNPGPHLPGGLPLIWIKGEKEAPIPREEVGGRRKVSRSRH